jgi:hypothetical protein
VSDTHRDKAIAAIVAERKRQVDDLGWTAEHDDKYAGTLGEAAACYAAGSRNITWLSYPLWPWGEAHWREETTRIRQLEKAGACILAELERLYRGEERVEAQRGGTNG